MLKFKALELKGLIQACHKDPAGFRAGFGAKSLYGGLWYRV